MTLTRSRQGLPFVAGRCPTLASAQLQDSHRGSVMACGISEPRMRRASEYNRRPDSFIWSNGVRSSRPVSKHCEKRPCADKQLALVG